MCLCSVILRTSADPPFLRAPVALRIRMEGISGAQEVSYTTILIMKESVSRNQKNASFKTIGQKALT